ncbi:LacI family DNA-binding transcriptional regulator [Nocardioides sp. TF02-7]|uniref:LacI family DNA-binding transcriptional regulator n=1 Tax=Nocardioides sp. TF02-7 TaxID=2917724 RepID=UPI001F05608A|nr:LacI family DNA-binding transcriptional regulator [Nocardioides sp. TF02-7]UMG91173.1 LacI family transcriptional regulator [Nocardioides sp. TF02-7]
MQTLGYTPNPAARSLVTRRTDSVGLVVPEPDERVFTDPFFVHTLRSVNRVLAARDLQLVLLLARPGEEERRMLRYLRRRHIDGAIVVSHHSADRLAEHLASLALPSAFVGRPFTGADKVAYVDTDNAAGARLATDRLIARGCQRIGTIAGPVDMAAGIDRLEGWRAAMRAAGLSDDAVAHGDFTEQGGADAAAELVDLHPGLDGLFVASDLMATGALRALAAAGKQVPADVAVIGYDDLGVAERTTPQLTTIRQPPRPDGRAGHPPAPRAARRRTPRPAGAGDLPADAGGAGERVGGRGGGSGLRGFGGPRDVRFPRPTGETSTCRAKQCRTSGGFARHVARCVMRDGRA